MVALWITENFLFNFICNFWMWNCIAWSSCFVEECLMLTKLKVTKEDLTLHFSCMTQIRPWWGVVCLTLVSLTETWLRGKGLQFIAYTWILKARRGLCMLLMKDGLQLYVWTVFVLWILEACLFLKFKMKSTKVLNFDWMQWPWFQNRLH